MISFSTQVLIDNKNADSEIPESAFFMGFIGLKLPFVEIIKPFILFNLILRLQRVT